MKKYPIAILIVLFQTAGIRAQHVGINTAAPAGMLHIKGY